MEAFELPTNFRTVALRLPTVSRITLTCAAEPQFAQRQPLAAWRSLQKMLACKWKISFQAQLEALSQRLNQMSCSNSSTTWRNCKKKSVLFWHYLNLRVSTDSSPQTEYQSFPPNQEVKRILQYFTILCESVEYKHWFMLRFDVFFLHVSVIISHFSSLIPINISRTCDLYKLGLHLTSSCSVLNPEPDTEAASRGPQAAAAGCVFHGCL